MQEDGDGPQGEHCEGLVRPPEVLPQHVETVGIGELPDEQHKHSGKHGHGNHQSLGDGLLVKFQEVGDDEPGAAQGGVLIRSRYLPAKIRRRLLTETGKAVILLCVWKSSALCLMGTVFVLLYLGQKMN